MQNISVLSVESAAIMQYNRNIGQSNYKESDEMEPNHDSVNGLDFEKTAVRNQVISNRCFLFIARLSFFFF